MASSDPVSAQHPPLVGPEEGPEESKPCVFPEFEDEKRIQLLKILEALAPNHEWPRAVWAFFWLSDLEMLEERVAKFKREDIQIEIVGIEGVVMNGAVVKKWLQLERGRASRPGTSGQTTPVPSPLHQAEFATSPPRKKRKLAGDSSPARPSSPDERSNQAKEMCLDRDRETCVITKAGDPHVAHIFPFSMRQLQDTPFPDASPWNVLTLFWTKDRIDSWYQAISTPAGTETVENLVSLAPSVHDYQGKAYFALQPRKLSEDKKRLTVRFYWMPRMTDLPNRVSLLRKPDIRNDLDMDGNVSKPVKLWNIESERKICSGDDITFETRDPENLPLPSSALLDMQWVVQRLSALAAGVDVEDDIESDDDDDDDDDGWGRIPAYDDEYSRTDQLPEWMEDCQSGQKERPYSPLLST
ncbi:hypothetical protein FQN50_004996 [Emmonsiellopsis sp. PD_5]|nr:hypothetical protein FQN50_004996 [Emmonsiellopsis sp. PD_5]